MDVSLLIRQRLDELGLDQKDLAAATQVTESYVSQLLARKKVPPAPGRTDIYEKISQFLGLPSGELARLANAQRRENLRKRVVEAPRPLFKEFRDLTLRKCEPARREEVTRVFEKEAFGELERLVTRTILDVAQSAAREELRSAEWLRSMASLSGRSFEQMRVALLEFLDSDVFQVSVEACATFLDPMINAWDIDLKTFAIEISLNPRLAPASLKRFEFTEVAVSRGKVREEGLDKFLRDPALSAGITEDEVAFLSKLRFRGRHPAPLYYYRELQNLRDPLHFPDKESYAHSSSQSE